MLASASIFKSRDGIAVVVVNPFMALLSFRGIDTPSLPAQGEQRRPSLFNIRRDNPPFLESAVTHIERMRRRRVKHVPLVPLTKLFSAVAELNQTQTVSPHSP